MARKNGQNHDIESIYEANINSARYGEQEERVLARIISKIKEFILSITDLQKRSYRDVKIKKLEEFWRENAVGIGLYNECVLWWGVRFERLLAALKSKRHKTSTELLRFWRKRTLGVWNDKRFRPWDPNNLRMDLVVDTAALKAEMTLTVPGRSPVVS